MDSIKSSQPIPNGQHHKLAPFIIWTIAFLVIFSFGDMGYSKESPNIVLIFTDDQGYQDIGCFGSTTIRTPHLDQMAEEGMKFTDFYSACSVCSPSRAALLTGSYPPRTGITQVLFPRHQIGLSPKEVTVAEILKEKGYATACIGKWHLGHHKKFLPTNQGFDTYFGIPYSNDMTLDPTASFASDAVFRKGYTLEKARTAQTVKNFVPLMRDNEIIEYPADQTTLTKRYTEEAIKFMTENKDNPFFIYLPHTMPHIPLFVTPEFAGKSAEGLYGDTIEELDWSVGQILKSIKSLGLDDNTLVVFTSDNGPWKLKSGHGGSAFPLRGYKFSTYEGGMRVPCIMRWPGKIPAGGVCNKVAATIDLMPTFTKLAGAEIPDDRVIDGYNIWSLMSGEKGASSPHSAYHFYKGTRLESTRKGDWKIRVTGNNKNRNVELYNLKVDISESNNIADSHPDKVKALMAEMQSFDSQLRERKRATGQLNP